MTMFFGDETMWENVVTQISNLMKLRADLNTNSNAHSSGIYHFPLCFLQTFHHHLIFYLHLSALGPHPVISEEFFESIKTILDKIKNSKTLGCQCFTSWELL